MELINKLIKKLKLEKYINRETITYVIIGMLTTIVCYGSYVLLINVLENSLVSNVISQSAAIIFAFIFNKVWVFQSKSEKISDSFREFIKFTAARLIGALLIIVVTEVVKICAGLNEETHKIHFYIINAGLNVFVVIMNYFTSKFIVFKKE